MEAGRWGDEAEWVTLVTRQCTQSGVSRAGKGLKKSEDGDGNGDPRATDTLKQGFLSKNFSIMFQH